MASGIYFILAPDHHGATHLSLILNNHPDILSLGQGNPSRSEDQICSCGEAVSLCPFWIKMDEAIEADESIDDNREKPFPDLLPQVPILVSNRILNNSIIAAGSLLANEIGVKAWRLATEAAERYFGIHDRFLSAAQEWYPHKAFVDGENSLLKFMAMSSMGFPVKGAIHLVRDPRSYVAERRRETPEATPEKISLEWLGRHNRIRKVKGFFTGLPFYTVRYEDVFGGAGVVPEKLLNFMALGTDGVNQAGNDAHKRHLMGIAGIAAPVNTEEWRSSLTEKEQESVVRTCEPLFSEFGYKSQN